MKRAIALVVGAVLLGSCQDNRSSISQLAGPSLNSVSEGRFGGNPDFFFGTPLAATPQAGDLNFDVGGSNGTLVPYVRVCETDGAPTPAGCVKDVTLEVTGVATGLSMTYNATVELYQRNWATKKLVVGTNYRIEIWGVGFSTAAEKAALDPRWLFGWRDIRNSPSVASCSGGEAFCNINYGKTIPVKARIEQYVFCPITRNCAVQFISAGQDATLEAQLDENSGAPAAQLFVPGQGGTNFPLAFEPCTPAENAAVSDAIDLPTFGPCLHTVTTFTGALPTPAIVSICEALDPGSFGLTAAQGSQLALHHFTNDLSRVTALPEAWECGVPTAGAVASRQPTALMRVARAVGNKLAGWVSPRPLMAATRLIDRGGGGSTAFVSSYFKFALPAKFEYVTASDATQAGFPGSSLTLSARVTDLFGVGVANARVRWSVFSSPAPGAAVTSPTPVLTDASGIAQATVQLSTTTGTNVFRAAGRGIAADGSAECGAPSPNTGSCNGPRSAYDPFLPIHVPEFDASGTEFPVDIAEGTRLVFTVRGDFHPQATVISSGKVRERR